MDNATIQTSGGEFGDLSWSSGVNLEAVDVVLVDGVESGNVGRLTSFDLVLEHVEGSTVVSSLLGGLLLSFQLSGELPVSLDFFEDEWGTIVTSSSNADFVEPEEVNNWQVGELDDLDFSWSTIGDVDEVEAGVVAGISELVARWRPLNGVHPRASLVFTKELTEDKLGSESGVVNSLVLSLDGSSEDTGLEVSGAGEQKDVVWMPVEGEDGRFVLLDVLADPPIVILFEVADGDALGTRGDGELVTFWAPLNVSGSTADTKNYESWLPDAILELPDISVSVLRAGNDFVGLSAPVNASNTLGFVVFTENEFEFPFASSLLQDVDFVVVWGEGELSLVAVPAVVRNTLSDLAWFVAHFEA